MRITASHLRNYIKNKEPFADFLEKYIRTWNIQNDCPFKKHITDIGIEHEKNVVNLLPRNEFITCMYNEKYDETVHSNVYQPVLEVAEVADGTDGPDGPDGPDGLAYEEDSVSFYGSPDFICTGEFIRKNYHINEVDSNRSYIVDIKSASNVDGYEYQIIFYMNILYKSKGFMYDGILIGKNCHKIIPFQPETDEIQGAINWRKYLNTSYGALETEYKNIMQGVHVGPINRYLYPNMGSDFNHPLKKIFAEKIGELTRIYYVGVDKRNMALDLGITSIDDPRLVAETFGMKKGTITNRLVNGIIHVNRTTTLEKMVIENYDHRYKWTRDKSKGICLFFDFELINKYHLSEVTEEGGSSDYVYMCSVLKTIDGIETDIVTFTDTNFNNSTNRNIQMQLEKYVFDMLDRGPSGSSGPSGQSGPITVYHWGSIEVTVLKKMNSLLLTDPRITFCDMCQNIMKSKECPVFVKGAYDFGLKSITSGLYKNGLINEKYETEDAVLDGLDSIVQIANCIREQNFEIFNLIVKYNQMDTRMLFNVLKCIWNYNNLLVTNKCRLGEVKN